MTYYTDLEAARAAVAQKQQELAQAQTYLDSLLAQIVPEGPDLSQFNAVDFTTLTAGFCFLRVADGNIQDSTYHARVASVRLSGIPFAPYYFGRVAADGNDQRNGREEAGMAIHFARDGGWGHPGDLELAYDFETLNGQSAAKAAQHVVQFVNTYTHIMGSGRRPTIYTNPGTWQQVVGELSATQLETIAECPLWVAHWNVPTPTVLSPWPAWTFWQYTSSGTLPGVTGPVDLNRFAGTASDLAALRISA